MHINGPIYISNIEVDSAVLVYSSQIFLSGSIVISNSKVKNTIMQFQSSCVMFNGPINISDNVGSIIMTNSSNVTFNGPITISMNKECKYIMLLQYSEIVFNRKILFKSNVCHQINHHKNLHILNYWNTQILHSLTITAVAQSSLILTTKIITFIHSVSSSLYHHKTHQPFYHHIILLKFLTAFWISVNYFSFIIYFPL